MAENPLNRERSNMNSLKRNRAVLHEVQRRGPMIKPDLEEIKARSEKFADRPID